MADLLDEIILGILNIPFSELYVPIFLSVSKSCKVYIEGTIKDIISWGDNFCKLILKKLDISIS